MGVFLLNNSRLITTNNPKSPAAEAYKILRTNIQFSNIDKEIKTIVITSSQPDEGKTTIIANYGVALAENNKKVLIIDGDLRKPTLHKLFKLSNSYGLTNILTSRNSRTNTTQDSISQLKVKINEKTINNSDNKVNPIMKAIQATLMKKLFILASGPIPPNPSEILGSKKMEEFLKQVKDQFDIILIDTPPVGVVTDAALLSTIVDGTILVCASGESIKERVKSSKDLLKRVNANILGVVLNKIPVNGNAYYKYHYYQYYDSYYREEKNKKIYSKIKNAIKIKGKISFLVIWIKMLKNKLKKVKRL